MKLNRVERTGMIGLLAFGAVSAIGGGVGLIGGWIDLPPEWLTDRPFSDYTVPGLILGIVVGGSQLVGLLALLRQWGWWVTAAGVAGAVMMGWIIGEVLIVGSESELMRWLQVVYFLNGLIEFVLAAAFVSARRYAR